MIKNNLFNLLIVLFVLFFEGFSTSEYPKDLPKCNRGDNECIQNAIQFILTNYPHGNEALGLPSMDPIIFTQFKIFEKIDHDDNDETAPVIIKFTGNNVEITGFSQATVTAEGFNKDIQSNNVTIKLDTPEFIAKADYVLERLRFKRRRHSGRGKYLAKLNDVQFVLKFLTKIVEKNDGKKYINVENVSVDYIPKTSYVEFKNSNDDKHPSQNKQESEFIQENATEFYELLRPAISKDWTKFANKLLQTIFNKFSVDQLFLD